MIAHLPLREISANLNSGISLNVYDGFIIVESTLGVGSLPSLSSPQPAIKT